MNPENIRHDFKHKLYEKIRITSEGKDRFQISNPFIFDDGDHLLIILKRKDGKWILSDEGHTYMHLNCDLDKMKYQKGTRKKIIKYALSVFNVQDRDGELIVPIEDDSYGDAFFMFVQALLKIGNL